MKKLVTTILIYLIALTPSMVTAKTIDVLIKGIDEGIKTNKQQDYSEAVMNAKLQAIERAGVEIESITKIENFQLKYDKVESKAKAILLAGFQVMDMGYQADGTYQVVLSGKIQIAEAKKDAKVTIVMHAYEDLRGLHDDSFELAERGGGIKYYTWEIFPEKLIETNLKHFTKKSPITGTYSTIINTPGHRLTGIDDENIQKARKALANNTSVICSTTSPMAIPLIVPSGKYYIDYSITLRRKVLGGKIHAPMQHGRDSSMWRANNWGPYEFVAKSGEYQRIECTPNGKNAAYVLDDFGSFLSYLILDSRHAWHNR